MKATFQSKVWVGGGSRPQLELISLNRIRTFGDVGCCDMFGGVRFVV